MPWPMRGPQSALSPGLGAPATPALWQSAQVLLKTDLPSSLSAAGAGAGAAAGAGVAAWFSMEKGTSRKKMFGVAPNLQTTSGYNGMMTFAHYAKQCGKALTTDCLINAMETGEPFQDIFGQAPVKFSKTNHLGAEELLVAQVQNGRWKAVATKQKYK